MAKYKKVGLNDEFNENTRYKESVKRLYNFIVAKETERRHWSGENFGNPEGMLHKIVRILIPVFSLYTVATMAIYCVIRDMQGVLMQAKQNYSGLSYDADIKYLGIIIPCVWLLIAVLIIGNTLLLFKKYKSGAITVISAAFIFMLHVLTQLNIPMASNEGYLSYAQFYGINCAVYFALILLAFYIIFCIFKVKRTAKRLTDEALIKISRGTNDMLSLADYSIKIDEYIEKEKQKIVKEMNERKSDFLHFSDEDEQE